MNPLLRRVATACPREWSHEQRFAFTIGVLVGGAVSPYACASIAEALVAQLPEEAGGEEAGGEEALMASVIRAAFIVETAAAAAEQAREAETPQEQPAAAPLLN